MTKKFLSLLMMLALAAALAGCNTVHGMGKDISSAGKSIERASDKK